MKQNKLRSASFSLALWAVVLAIAALCFHAALSQLSRGHSDAAQSQLESALRRAAVACYAAAGVYPPTLDYLTEHYGIQIGGKYTVYYEVFASNLMPDITVLEKSDA